MGQSGREIIFVESRCGRNRNEVKTSIAGSIGQKVGRLTRNDHGSRDLAGPHPLESLLLVDIDVPDLEVEAGQDFASEAVGGAAFLAQVHGFVREVGHAPDLRTGDYVDLLGVERGEVDQLLVDVAEFLAVAQAIE